MDSKKIKITLMRALESDLSTASEAKREGLRYITQSVYSVLKEHKECTYQFICKNVIAHNSETANRRIYDVLNVMRAVKLAGKRGKIYFLIDNADDLKKKRSERNRLRDMKDTLLFITTRNELMGDTDSERLYLPFMVITTDKKSEIYCDTNEERNYFNFKSNKPLKIYEDLAILKEIREQTQVEAKEQSTHLSMDAFMF